MNVRFNGKIDSIDTLYSSTGKWVINSFYSCKYASRGETNNRIKYEFNLDKRNGREEKINNYEFKPIVNESKNGQLEIHRPIKKRKRIRYKKLRGGIHFIFERAWHTIFPVKFNLSIQPAYKFDESVFVWILIDKKDLEYGNWLIIEIEYETKKVKDWCETVWIQ